MSEQPVREPLAIIGIGCHYPGDATGPQAFWDLLTAGVDATRDVPGDRWDVRKFYDADGAKSGKMHTFHGGYLERVDQFDAQFFGISPREAMWLDPQQRLLLRVAWEAMEDGGQVPDRLAGSDVGVFVGGFTLDYQLLQNSGIYGRYHLHTHSATGMMMTMLANRLSFAFDFRGPSLTVDTACSGSLVAVHLAAQSIWNGECTMALAGGVNLMISPNMTIAETKSGFLSPGGRCRTFDAGADGYARGEGAGVVLVKPLDRALADRDPVYALIRGSAVSQDGHTGGITVPSGAAQEVVMRTAYRRAGVAPHEVGYVEAHGTGTPLGDPIEATAIGTVLSGGRPADRACMVGSVKTNIGHLEAAAGVAGLTKAALALKHGAVPPHLHLREPNPAIDFDALALRVPTDLTEWPRTATPRYAGVNSFGFGGTNAHVVLQEPPPEAVPAERAPEGAEHHLLPLSARSPEALVAQARSHRDFLAATAHHLHDVAYSAALRRSHHDHRLTVTAASRAQAVEQLDAFLEDRAGNRVPAGRVAPTGAPRIAFVCSGMGPQWWAMGRELLGREPVFRAAVQRCDEELARYTGWSLMEELTAPEDRSRMAATEVAQPANFAIQVGLAELWRSWGIEPDAVVGHSTGEVAAQYLTGALSFADAVKVTYYRSSLQQRTAGTGRMLAVGMTRETQEKAVRDAGPLVSVAAINSPSAVTLSGDAAALEDMAATAEKFGIFHRFLAVEVPYHSHLMDPLRDDLLTGLADLSPQQARIPLYSTVTGTRISGTGVGADYWWQNVRATVLFETAFTQMIADGYTTFVELSPHPVLAGSMHELLALEGREGLVVPSLRRGEPERPGLLTSLGALYTRGCPVAWERFSDESSRFVALPTYPWQLRTHWTESQEAAEDRHYTPVHPLLGQRLGATHPTWELELGAARLPYLADHRIQDTVVLPGSAFVEMALAAAREVYGDGGADGSGGHAVEDLVFRKALVLTDASDPRLRTVLDQERATVEFSSYTPSATGEARWTVHASATLCRRRSGRSRADLGAPDGATAIDRDAFYRRTAEMGFQYGPAFQAVQEVHTGSGRAVGRVAVPDLLAEGTADYVFHPALLDSAFQVLLTAAGPGAHDAGAPSGTPYLPVGIDRVRVVGRPTARMQVAAAITHADDRLIVSDIAMYDPDGRLLVEIEGFRAQSLETSMSLAPERIDRGLYELQWHPGPLTPDDRPVPDGPADPADWLVLTDGTGVGEALTAQLGRAGDRVVTVAHGDVPHLRRDPGTDRFELDRSDPEQYRQLVAELAERAPFARVVHLWSLDSEFTGTSPVADLDREQRRGVGSIVALMQALAQSGWPQLPQVWLVTRRAQAVGSDAGPVAVEQAPVWGLGRVIGHQEFTGIWGGLVDLDDGPPSEQAGSLLEEITGGSGEDQVAFRAGERHVARLVPSVDLTPTLPVSLRADGSYLVTGGLGSLGMLVARFLVARGARRLVLMGRTAVPDRTGWHEVGADHPQRALVDELLALERLGATVVTAAVDVADEEQLAGWLAAHEREARPPIRGVVHTAGVVSDELLLRMSPENLERVLAPKVRGGWLLHQVLADQPLDFFVLFSSTGSVIASLGQGNYAAGNAFLDALARHRRGLGRPAVSVGWGPWSVGMVAELDLERAYARRGIELITPEAGMQILARVMGRRPAHLVAITANWATAREASPHPTLPPMFSLLGDQPGDPTTDGAEDGAPSLLARLRGAPARERAELLAEHLRAVAAGVLELDPDGLGVQEPLTGLGMDSMMAIEVKHRIEAAVQVDVSVLELLQGATVTGLADRLLSALSFADGPPDPDEPEPAPAGAAADPGPSTEEIDRLIAETADADLERLLAELEHDTSQEGQR